MAPFTLSFTLSRRHRLMLEVPPWLPAIAATTGFVIGTTFAGLYASRLFFLLLVLPPIVYHGLFALVFNFIVIGGRPVTLHVDDVRIEIITGGRTQVIPLSGLFQVFCEGSTWTLLHLDGTVVTIPAGAITAEQVAYLRTFAHRTAATLRAEHG